MGKGFLLKIFVLAAAVAAVLVVVIFTSGGDLREAVTAAGQRQTFLAQFVIAGGPIVWFVLLPMSVVMVSLAVEESFNIRRRKLLPRGIAEEIIEIINGYGPEGLEERIGDRGDLISVAVLRAVGQCRGDWLRMRSAIEESLQEQACGLLRRIEWLNLIGTVSPMVGLFGTVVGMIKLFNAIVAAGGQPQPAQLADGISVALVTTFWGLLIAIPALAVHSVFNGRVETLVGDAANEAEDIALSIRGGIKQRQGEAVGRGQPIRELPVKPAKGTGESVRLR